MDVFCIDSVDIDSIECIRDPCLVSTVSTYIVLIIWLESAESQLSKNFLQIENPLNIKKVMGRNVWMCFVSTVSDIDSIECIRDPGSCIDSIDIYSIDHMVEKPRVSVFQNFLRIENPLNIKKVMGRNVWMCFDSSINSLDKHSIQCIACF